MSRRGVFTRRVVLPLLAALVLAAQPTAVAPAQDIAIGAGGQPNRLVQAIRVAPPAVPADRAAPAAVSLTAPGPPAAVGVPGAGLPRHERIGQAALGRLRYVRPADLDWEVRFHEGRAGYLGMADWEARVIDVWVRSSHDVEDVLGTLAHEFAHVHDYERWTQETRQEWLELRGVDVAWWPACTCDDRGFGAGDIAEALVVLEAGPGQWTGRFGPPTQAQLDWLAARL